MAELLRTNDPALLSVIEGLLAEAEIPHHVADRDMSNLEGSTLVIQQRVLVPDGREAETRALVIDADLGEWLRR
jgi:Putative prokaryotic signal transducing protein